MPPDIAASVPPRVFDGAIELFDRRCISGWAKHAGGGKQSPLDFELHFVDRPPLAVTRMTSRREGVGFVFDLPAEFHAMPWEEFIAAYTGVLVLATHVSPPLRWRPLLYKNALLQLLNDVRSQLHDLLPRRFAGAPPCNVAAVTQATGAAPLLTYWARHHAEIVGAENLYIIDAGINDDVIARLPCGANVFRLSADRNPVKLYGRRVDACQRFLLETYDAVLSLPSSAFLCMEPALAGDRSAREALLAIPAPGAIATAWSVWHNFDVEPVYDDTRPILSQRHLLTRETALDRPVFARLPARDEASGEPLVKVPGLHVLYLGMCDLDLALEGAFDPEEGPKIVNQLRIMGAEFARHNPRSFDPSAPFTVIPNWMREVLTV